MNGTGLHGLHHGLHDGLKTEHFSVVEGKNSKIMNRILNVNLSGSKEDTGAGHPQQHLKTYPWLKVKIMKRMNRI